MFFFPRLVEERYSRFNGIIRVYKLFGKYSLSVDNLTQSGGLLEPIWRKGLKIATRYLLPATNCLILGLGGGTAVQLVTKFWPQAKITAIDIDPVMIALGKKYFGLKTIENLKIIKGDVFKIITHYSLLTPHSYDLILVDVYIGKTFPVKGKSKPFLSKLKKYLAPHGVVIFNRLNYKRNELDIRSHITALQSVFPIVTTKKIISNTLVFCSLSR